MATHNNAEPSHKNPDNFVRNGKPVGELQRLLGAIRCRRSGALVERGA